MKKEAYDGFERGETMNPIENYILQQPQEHQERLFYLDKIITESLSDMTQKKISWGMPTYHRKHHIIHFARNKHHIGLYPGPDAIIYFEEQLKDFKYSKGTIQFSDEKELPEELIKVIAKWCDKNVSD